MDIISLQNLIENLKNDFRRARFDNAQEDAGELGQQMESLVTKMIQYEFGSESRHYYMERIYEKLELMKHGVTTGFFERKTLTVYRVLYKYGIMT